MEQLPPTDDVRRLRQRIAQLEGEKLELYKQREELARVKAELSLPDLARSLALAAAAGEASAPDRAVRSLAATVQGHFTVGPDGVGIRFQPPELGDRTAGLGRASFELAKVPPAGELVAAAASIAAHERRMALSFRGGEGQPYRTSTRSLVWLVNAIVTKTEASASDLLALSATLAATTAAARELLR